MSRTLAPNKPEVSRKWAPLEQGAAHIGVSTKTLRRLIASGRVTGYRMGTRLIRVDLNELDNLLTEIPTAGGGARD
jgi:excisionase family DNA binding protein